MPWLSVASLAISKAFLWLDKVKLGSWLAFYTFACLFKLFTAFKNALRALRTHLPGILVPARLCEICMAMAV